MVPSTKLSDAHDAQPTTDCPLDWPAVAGLLAEWSETPLVLLGCSGQILLFSAAMEKALGWRRHEVEGRAWADACVPANLASETRIWLGHALRGAVRRYETEVATRDGRRLSLVAEASLVGRAREQGLLLAVQSVNTAPSERDLDPCDDARYEISTVPSSFGLMRRIRRSGASLVVQTEPLRPCHVALRGLATPCCDCPALQPPNIPWPRTVIRVRKDKQAQFEIVTAEMTDEGMARITVRSISEQVLASIHEARIREVADGASLTDRERSVLTYLVMGRSLEDIGKILSISTRTVKFHQANVLEKLGADSRVDLVRLIL